MYDLAIIGGGPAGVAAGVYAARKRLKTVFITEEFGGQSLVSEDIQNWIGTISIPGEKLASDFEAHLRHYADQIVDIKKGEKVEKISKDSSVFEVKTNKGLYKATAVLIATGSHRRKLEIPGATEYENKGITYCASCDGPLFADKDTTVIGGGNAAFETAAQLLAYAKSVTLLNRSEKFRADEITTAKVLSNSKMKAIKNGIPVRIKGDKFVTSIVYKDNASGKEIELPTEGIFVEIGLLPTTGFVKGLVEMNNYNQIKVNPLNQETSVSGIWAAGDCTDTLYHQNNIAAGDGVRALEGIYVHLRVK